MKRLLVIFFIFPFSMAFSQDIIYMPYLEVVNIPTSYEKTLTLLMQEKVNTLGKYQLIIPEESDTGYVYESLFDAMKTARDQNAKYLLTGIASVFNNKLMVKFTMYNALEGNKVWQDEVKNQKIQDLEIILIQFAQKLGSQDKIEYYGDKSENEIWFHKTFVENASFKFGAKLQYNLLNVPGRDNQNLPGFGIDICYDIKYFFFDFNYDLFFSDDKFATYNLSVSKPIFSMKDNTPYVKFAMGGSSITVKKPAPKETNGGLLILFGGGYAFNRYKDFGFRLHADYFKATYQLVGSDISGIIVGATIQVSP